MCIRDRFLFGALHLKPEERAELLGLIDGYLRTHSVPEGGVEHWEYCLLYTSRCV